jgi:spore maturation protein SpmA/spore maturation protein SpmB
MALSRIWSFFIIVAIVAAGLTCLFSSGNKDVFSKMVVGKAGDTTGTRIIDSTQLPPKIETILSVGKDMNYGDSTYSKTTDNHFTVYKQQASDGIFATCTNSVNLCLGLIGYMALFMGFMAIAEKAGGIRFLSRLIQPFFSKLFPEVPKDHPAFGHMMMNFSANLLGLDNAATPFGIRAMESLQEINPDKEKASNSQIMFLCLHASGLTLIPVTIIAFRSKLGAVNPTDIFIPCMIATFVATIASMLIVSYKQKINVFQPVILGWILGISSLIALLVVYTKHLNKDAMASFSGTLSNGLILLIFLLIVLGGMYKKINIYEAFVEGAKGGFETAVRIIPYFVGMLVAISMLRTSGVFDLIVNGAQDLFALIGFDTRFVPALPTALIKPLSGSGARGMLVDTMKTYGADSFAGRLSSILQGSSDTTFYVIAVYFGAVNIKNTRYSIGAMLLADLVGIITSILLAYLFFGTAVN